MNVLYHHRTRGEDVEGVHIRGIVHALRELGHQVDVVSPPGVDVDRERPLPAATAAPTPRRASPWSLVSKKAPELMFEAAEMAYNAYAAPALAAKLARTDYRLLYERYALFSVAGVLTAERRGLPFILEVNDSAVVSRIRPLKLQAAARRIERFVWGRADAIVTITGYFRDLIVEAGVPPDRVFVIPNAVDGAAFAEAPDGRPVRERLGLAGKVTIGYVGAINFWRRVDLLVDAFAALAPRHPEAHLVLIGDGPDRQAVADAARKAGLEGRVHLPGKVAHSEIPAHLAALDITVIPHSNTYGSPMKLFEYMAAGRVVVAPWLPPIVEVIGDDDGGVLFAPLDRSALESTLDRLIGDASCRATIGARAREKALTGYVWRRHAQSILDIHAELTR